MKLARVKRGNVLGMKAPSDNLELAGLIFWKFVLIANTHKANFSNLTAGVCHGKAFTTLDHRCTVCLSGVRLDENPKKHDL